jgi:hypothetical protein
MLLLRRALEAVASGLLAALLAPPVAAAAFLLISVASFSTDREHINSSLGSVLLLILGATTGAYLIGAIPAFLAGLVLPTLGRVLSPTLAAAAAGLVGTIVYSMTFGSHHLTGMNLIGTLVSYALPAFIGVSVAARLVLHIEKRHAEASYLDGASSTTVNNADVDQAGRNDAGEA